MGYGCEVRPYLRSYSSYTNFYCCENFLVSSKLLLILKHTSVIDYVCIQPLHLNVIHQAPV